MMKHGPITWQFGDDEVVIERLDSRDRPQPAHAADPKRRRRTWLMVFLVALVASWTTGFYMGRVQRTTAVLEAEVQGRLDIESWAWQQGDWTLFRSLLPPRTPSWRLKALQAMFDVRAPENLDMLLTHYVVSEDGSEVAVTAQVSVGDQQYEVKRTYRLMDGRWRLVRLGEFD
ncbi:MAG: hypothetical protein ACE5LU_19975 [Anaerolineae bacterium]